MVLHAEREEPGVVRWFRRRLGFQEVEVVQLVEWKENFSSYHRDLVRGLSFLIKQLQPQPLEARA